MDTLQSQQDAFSKRWPTPRLRSATCSAGKLLRSPPLSSRFFGAAFRARAIKGSPRPKLAMKLFQHGHPLKLKPRQNGGRNFVNPKSPARVVETRHFYPSHAYPPPPSADFPTSFRFSLLKLFKPARLLYLCMLTWLWKTIIIMRQGENVPRHALLTSWLGHPRRRGIHRKLVGCQSIGTCASERYRWRDFN